MDYFRQYVSNIAIFLILSGIVLIILPERNAGLHQMAKLIMGFILLILLVSPITEIINTFEKNPNKLLDQVISSVGTNVVAVSGTDIGGISYKEFSETIEEGRNDLILEAYKTQLSTDLNEIVNKNESFKYLNSNFTINDDLENFGEILSVELTVSKKENKMSNNFLGLESSVKKETIIPFIKVEKISISKEKEVKEVKENQKNEDLESEEIKSLKNLILDVYNLPHDNIYIIEVD